MNPLTVVRALLDLVLMLVPHGIAQDELSEAAIRRANAVADGAEKLKWPGESQ